MTPQMRNLDHTSGNDKTGKIGIPQHADNHLPPLNPAYAKSPIPEPTLQEQIIDEYTTEYRVNLMLDIIEKQGVKDAIGYLYGMTTPIAETQAAHTKREEYADYLAQAIKALIEKAERKARIEELNNLYDEAETPEQYDTCDVVHDHRIAERIKELSDKGVSDE